MRNEISYEDARLDTLRSLVREEMASVSLGRRTTLRKFADWLIEGMPRRGDEVLSHATIINWRKHGKPPSTDFFEKMLVAYPPYDRRHEFALKVLAAKSPHVWGFEGVVWRLKASRLAKAE